MNEVIEPKNLLKKLAKVMSDVSFIQKDKRNEKQSYNYASEATIKAHFHKSFLEHGVLFYWSTDSISNEKFEVQGSSGIRTVFQSTVFCTFKFVDADNNEALEGKAIGVGQDSGDKAVYKAITGALKYALTANFLVETGDDPEVEEEKVSVPKRVVTGNATVVGDPKNAKMCPSCDKVHEGKYAKCIECWKKDQK